MHASEPSSPVLLSRTDWNWSAMYKISPEPSPRWRLATCWTISLQISLRLAIPPPDHTTASQTLPSWKRRSSDLSPQNSLKILASGKLALGPLVSNARAWSESRARPSTKGCSFGLGGASTTDQLGVGRSWGLSREARWSSAWFRVEIMDWWVNQGPFSSNRAGASRCCFAFTTAEWSKLKISVK